MLFVFAVLAALAAGAAIRVDDADRPRLRADAVQILREGAAERAERQLEGAAVAPQNAEALVDRLHKRALERYTSLAADEDRQLAFVASFDRDVRRRRKRQGV